jgi:hypothetical protein
MKRSCLGFIIAIGLTLPAFGQGVDPYIGTWKLNVEKSTSTALAKSQVNVVTKEGQDFITTGDGIDAQGQAFKLTFTVNFDGQPHPSTGSLNYDSTAYVRIGNTFNLIRYKNGKTVEVGQIVIVPGKTLTATAEGIAANGQSYHYAVVFDRQ